jgi:D-alanine--poly(phosphoribitol) ligase subunit 2
MTREEQVIQAIFGAIDEINQQLPRAQRLEKSTQTALLDGAGKLDSLGLINLIVATEQRIEEVLGIAVSLIDDDVLSQDDGPFRSVGTLSAYIHEILEQRIR